MSVCKYDAKGGSFNSIFDLCLLRADRVMISKRWYFHLALPAHLLKAAFTRLFRRPDTPSSFIVFTFLLLTVARVPTYIVRYYCFLRFSLPAVSKSTCHCLGDFLRYCLDDVLMVVWCPVETRKTVFFKMLANVENIN